MEPESPNGELYGSFLTTKIKKEGKKEKKREAPITRDFRNECKVSVGKRGRCGRKREEGEKKRAGEGQLEWRPGYLMPETTTSTPGRAPRRTALRPLAGPGRILISIAASQCSGPVVVAVAHSLIDATRYYCCAH